MTDREMGKDAAEEVRAWLEAQTVRGLRPVAVELRRDEDSAGERAWFYHVVLPDPDPTEGTWPVEFLNEFDRATRDRALDAGVPWPWYVVFRPETDESQDDEDAQLQITDE